LYTKYIETLIVHVVQNVLGIVEIVILS